MYFQQVQHKRFNWTVPLFVYHLQQHHLDKSIHHHHHSNDNNKNKIHQKKKTTTLQQITIVFLYEIIQTFGTSMLINNLINKEIDAESILPEDYYIQLRGLQLLTLIMFTDFNVSIFEDLDFFFEFDKDLILRERERETVSSGFGN